MCAPHGETPNLHWKFLALLAVLAGASSTGSACPKTCACYVPTEVHCTFRYLSTMPSGIQTTVERINMGYNSLTMLRESELSGLENLELLMLHSNIIQTIEDTAFHNLKALQVLKMSYNRVKELRKEMFKGLDNLLRLHMDHNRIQFVHPEAFYGLTSLQLVHLEGNLLQQLHPDTFVTLRASQIFKFSTIKTIYLSENALTTLPATLFTGCYQLESLFLHGNPWSCDCYMDRFALWMERNPGVLKCKREKFAEKEHCPVCQSPVTFRGSKLVHLSSSAYTCSKPWIHSSVKQRNITLPESNFIPVFAKDFIAPVGMIEMNITDQYHNDASIACVVQRPAGLDNLNVTQGMRGKDSTTITASVATSLICNIDYDHIRQLWSILAMYSDSPLRVERELLLSIPQEMIYKYKQVRRADDEIFTGIELEIKSNPAWLMQNIISFQLDRTTTTYSALHIKFISNVEMHIENKNFRGDGYSWTMIERNNDTKTESSVLSGGLVELNCKASGDPKPSIEWILPDGSKVRAPYNTEDRRIIIADNGKLTLRAADSLDSGIYRCIATNYLDADVLSFRVTVLSPDVEELDVNGVQLSHSVGESLFLDCEITSNPQASVHWILPDHTIMDKSSGNKKLYENGTLGIHSLSKRDRGFYRCLAANHRGVDLLTSLITVSGDWSNRVRLMDTEGSGDEGQLSREDSQILYDKDLSSRISQESRTVTSDRLYPRQRAPLRRFPTNRRGNGTHTGWRRFLFDKASRKVNPENLAEFLKRSQNNKFGQGGDSRINKSEKLKNNKVYSVSSKSGSGNEVLEGDNSNQAITITENPENYYSHTMTTYQFPANKQGSSATMTDVVTDTPVNIMTATDSMTKMTRGSYTYTDVSPVKDGITFAIQKDYIIPITATQGYTFSQSNSKSHRHEQTVQPLTLKFTVTDSGEEMDLQFSGDVPRSVTEVMTQINSQNPNVTHMINQSAQRVNPLIQTSADPESQTILTAVTTERGQDEIMFHTTQRIKSPRLPPGSTIISHQQIHIIPPNKKQPGKRRNFFNRRRVIQTSKITDIKSILDKFKRPKYVIEGNATVPNTAKITDCVTDCDDEKKSKTKEEQIIFTPTNRSFVPMSSLRMTKTIITTTLSTPFVTSTKIYPKSNSFTDKGPSKSYEYIISTDGFQQKPTQNPMKQVPTTVTATNTTAKASKAIEGKIPWHRLFSGKQSHQEISNRKPAKTSTTIQSKTSAGTITSTVPSMVVTTLPTADAVVAPVTASPSDVQWNQDNLDMSSEYLSGSFTELQSSNEVTTSFITAILSTTTSNRPVTTPAYGSRLTKAVVSQITLPVPPTIRTSPKEDNIESSSSSSDLRGKGEFAGRPWRNRKPGFHRRRYRGKRPVNKTTTQAPATKSTFKTTSPTLQIDSSIYRSSLTPILVKSLVSIPPRITDSNSEEWRNTAKTTTFPKTHSVKTEPTPTSYTYFKILNTAKPYSTTPSLMHGSKIPVNSSKRRPSAKHETYQMQRPAITTENSKGSDSGHRDHLEQFTPANSSVRQRYKEFTPVEKTITFDIVTVLASKESYKESHIANGVSNTHEHTTAYGNTLINTIANESSIKDMMSKPRIVGENATSFTIQSNSDVFLPCEATGNPKPDISWQRFSSSTGSTLTITGKMGKFDVFRNGTLLIQNANIKDHGEYLCMAKNSLGSDKRLVTLSVPAYPSRILGPKVRGIKVHSGKTVEMNCKAVGKPVPLVSWILANHTQVSGQHSELGRVTVTPEGTLVIQQVSVYDIGHYKCIASNPAGADTTTVHLQVVAAPPGILEQKQQLVSAGSGQSVWIPCTAQGDPKPRTHWVLFNGTVVKPHYTDSKASAFSNGTLYIKNLDVSDSGKYECIATSSTGSERRVVTLTVEKTETAPRITETSQRWTELDYGSWLQLNCCATGNPKPQIIWRLPSKALVDQWHRMGSHIKVLVNGTLVIDAVSEKDAGDYLCVARSKIGDDFQLMRVSVSMKPAKIEPKVIGKMQVPYGKNLKVDCKALGAPIPEISWGLPDGTLVNTAYQSDSSKVTRSKRYSLFDNGTLFLNNVGLNEEGDYTCYAKNTMGRDEMRVRITIVTATPRIHPSHLIYAKVKIGANIRFDCEAVGEPKPKILWVLPSSDMIAASNERYLMHVNGSLDIREIKLADAGEYVCLARNAAGEESRVYKLDIDGNPPVINGFYQNRTVVKEAAAKYTRKLIDCKAEGDPLPKITWIMPDNIFLSAPYFGSRVTVYYNGTLEIRNVRPTDTAEFICIAQNDGGEAVMVVHLEVTSQLKRPIFKNPFNERLVTQLGKTAVLNCSADGQPPPDIIWTLPNGNQFSKTLNRVLRYHQGHDGTFVVYNASKEDTGKYRCAAKNSVGYIEKVIVLEVGQKPYILTRPKGIVRSVSGEHLFLHCLAAGSPRPNILWTTPGGHTVTRPQSSGRYQLIENGTLVIHPTKLHDRGNYMCRAKNEAGEAVLTVAVLIIAYPPRITSGPPPNLKTISGTPVQLNCIAVGIPKPEISWELPDQSVLTTAGKRRTVGSELLLPQGTLVIQKPTRADSGPYKCLATNHLGTDTKATYISVI